ncbi:MAG TPA: YggS family pyridoxal phosphate-dependent enzyme [Rectinemataceae bacterium]|nr:YggS family pyridoxal phosphate-dependent enzyme [Rectinemataceae bacterium]
MDEKGHNLYEDYLSAIGTRLASLRRRAERAAARTGRDSSGIEIVAVSKFHPAEAVEAALACGIKRFAESRVQEAESKFKSLSQAFPDLRLDLIGHLQGNKVKRALSIFDRIQSVDSLDLLESLVAKIRDAREETENGPIMEILFELHTGEESKSGFPDIDSVRKACEYMLALPSSPGLELRGLMTMAPLGAGEKAIRSSFGALRALRESLVADLALPDFTVLSMGMSGDFEIAIEEGATEIRIGTALFGERPA